MKKLITLILSILIVILIVSSYTFIRSPKDYPLIVTSIRQSSESDYSIYVIEDSNPSVQGWGRRAMYIELKDKRNKFNIGDTIVFNKK